MLAFAARTHPGRREGENEDAIGCDPAHSLWLVADGMGGHAAGAAASAIVKDTVLKLAGEMPLEGAVLRAHEAIAADAAAIADHHGMGSTVVAAQLEGSRCTIVWVGDSRAYLWRGKSLKAVTRDHSLMEELRTHAGLTETEIRQHPNRHVVTRTLGLGTPVPSRYDMRLRRGDWIVLCSDGLNDEMTDAAIADVLQANEAPDQAGDALVEAALAHGGNDNVSVIVVAYEKDSGQFSGGLGARMAVWLSIIAGAAVGALVAAAFALLHGRH